MIRTNVVKLTYISALAYRQKLQAGDTGIIIVRPDVKQPGIASISKKTGEPVLTKNTPVKDYPLEAFKEAMELTAGLPFRKQGNIKVTDDMFVDPVEENNEEAEVVVDSREYQKILDKYTDKNEKFSYDLLNKDLISFAHRSKIVRNMIADKISQKEITEYIVDNKIRNITGNHDMSAAQVNKIVELLDEVSPKGVFKDLNAEIRKLLKK